MGKPFCIDEPVEDSTANGEIIASKILSGWRIVNAHSECSEEQRASLIRQVQDVINLSNEKMNFSVHYMFRSDPYIEWQRVQNNYILQKKKQFTEYLQYTDPMYIAKDAALGALSGIGYMMMFFYALALIGRAWETVSKYFRS